MARAAGELGAAVESMETATQKILGSVEAIDDCARALASVLNTTTTIALRRMCRTTLFVFMRPAISRICRPAHRQSDHNADHARRAARGHDPASRRRRRATDSGIEAFTSDRTNQWSPTRWSGRTCEPTRHRRNVCLARPADRDKTNQRDRRKAGGKSQRRRIGSAFDH